MIDTNLVGKWLEICWPYKMNGKTVEIWASGKVKCVADGLTDRRNKKAQSVLPAPVRSSGHGRRTRNMMSPQVRSSSSTPHSGIRMFSMHGATTHASRHRRAAQSRRPESSRVRQMTSI